MPERAAGTTPTDDGGEVSASGMLRVTATRPAARGEQGSGGEPLLVLTSASGEVFHLPVDGSLRAAVRSATASPAEASPTGGPTPLRPKDIQARIRGGESAAEVAEAAGVTLDAVDRYAGPVLAERSHVATVARATLVRSARSRPSLEDLVRHRLASRGVALATVAWDAWRRGESGWVLQVGFRAGTRDRVAQWRFDPVAELVDPLDDEARWLSASHEAESPGAGASSRRLSSVRVFDVEDEGGLEGGTGSLPAVDPDAGAPPRGGDEAGPAGPGAAQEPWEGPDHDEVAARTMDLLDALSDRRGRRQPMVDLEDDLDLDEDGDGADEVDQTTQTPSPQEDGGIGPGYGSGFPAHQRPAPGRAGRGSTHLRAVAPPQGEDDGGATAPAPAEDRPAPGLPVQRVDADAPVVDRPAPEAPSPQAPAPATTGSRAAQQQPFDPEPAPEPTGPARPAGQGRRDRGGPSPSSAAVADVPTTGSIGRWVGPASPTALPATTTATTTGPLAPRGPAAPAETAQPPAAGDETDVVAEPKGPVKAPRSGGTRSRGGRRSSVPSWDEIVFGSAPEDPKP